MSKILQEKGSWDQTELHPPKSSLKTVISILNNKEKFDQKEETWLNFLSLSNWIQKVILKLQGFIEYKKFVYVVYSKLCEKWYFVLSKLRNDL